MLARPGRLRISVSQAFQLRPEPLPGSGEGLVDELDHAAALAYTAAHGGIDRRILTMLVHDRDGPLENFALGVHRIAQP